MALRKYSSQALVTLSALMRWPCKWQHGYEISKATGLKSGTLYPILMRLSDEGFLDSQWEDAERPGRPPRHGYRLTVLGMSLAREQLKTAPGVALRPITAD
jgi:DNA-binding PadR family transcriptional regulator